MCWCRFPWTSYGTGSSLGTTMFSFRRRCDGWNGMTFPFKPGDGDLRGLSGRRSSVYGAWTQGPGRCGLVMTTTPRGATDHAGAAAAAAAVRTPHPLEVLPGLIILMLPRGVGVPTTGAPRTGGVHQEAPRWAVSRRENFTSSHAPARHFPWTDVSCTGRTGSNATRTRASPQQPLSLLLAHTGSWTWMDGTFPAPTSKRAMQGCKHCKAWCGPWGRTASLPSSKTWTSPSRLSMPPRTASCTNGLRCPRRTPSPPWLGTKPSARPWSCGSERPRRRPSNWSLMGTIWTVFR
mmetsp:Transcript_7370/g.10427  ORF Transcript_7370/g.10427 Transcript_7370/m.10427 type:complete len:292 (-) Transcript_7370:678-1553(-)